MNAANYTTGIFIRPLACVFRSHGRDCAPLLRQHGLEPAQLYQAGSRIDVAITSALLTDAALQLNDPCLGISMSRFGDYSGFGALGQALMAGGTVQSVLQRIVRFHRLVSDVATPALVCSGDQIAIRFEASGVHQPHPQAMLFILACILRLLRLRVNAELNPLQVTLPPAVDASEGVMRPFFRCPLHIANGFSMSFSRDEEASMLEGSDMEMAGLIELSLRQRLHRIRESGFVAELLQWIETSLPHGEPLLAQAASRSGVSSRSLQRKLAVEGVSWQQLIERARQSLVERHLGISDLSVTELAFLSGYADVSSFSRAFKRWYGVSPTQFE